MSPALRALFALIIPPIAVHDKGWDKIIITTALWFMTGIAGNIAAFYFAFDGRAYDRWKAENLSDTPDFRRDYAHRYREDEKPKRHMTDEYHEYIELADGDVLQVVDTEDEERRKRLGL